MTKVLIDNRWAGNTGIGRLYRHIIANKPFDADVSFVKTTINLGSPLSPVYLAGDLKKSDVDVFYSPSFMPPIQSHVPFVITIHDLNHLYYYSKFHKFYLKYVISILAKSAKQIITVSEYTKRMIVNELNIRSEKITVVYNGVDDAYSLNTEKYNINRPYFLYLGNRRPYKNIDRMLEAFAIANISNDYMFLMSGECDAKIQSKLVHLKINDKVRFLGSIDEKDLPKIYKGAHALLFVSLMEGFGLPIIEAMASGVPVITSNITSMPEIAGGAAILVDPFSVKDIANALQLLTKDHDLYNELIQLGSRRQKIFRWHNTADLTWNIILK
jgi:glycosyltransferase involved in cell wall biosynthesis